MIRMATTLWRLWMTAAGMAGATCAVVAWLFLPQSIGTALTTGLLIALCAPSAFVVLSFLVAIASGPRSSSAANALHLIRALVLEIIDFNLAVLAMMTSTPPMNPLPGRVIRRPVMLIHGFVCNHSVWRQWLGCLEDRGFGPVRVVDLEPPFADIEHHASQVERELRALFQECGETPVDIIAHSMGGLVARAALRRIGSGVIGQIVTLATPHHGTVLARLFPQRRLVQQMAPESSWLKQLNAEQANGLGIPVTSIYSLEDNLVVPARSATLEHAHLIELRGIGHLGLLSSHKAIDAALASLASNYGS